MFFVFCLVILVVSLCVSVAQDEPRTVNLHNQLAGVIGVYWIPPQNQATGRSSEGVEIRTIAPLFSAEIQTFVGHVFEWRQLPDEAARGRCTQEGKNTHNGCLVGRFTVDSSENQVIFAKKDLVPSILNPEHHRQQQQQNNNDKEAMNMREKHDEVPVNTPSGFSTEINEEEEEHREANLHRLTKSHPDYVSLDPCRSAARSILLDDLFQSSSSQQSSSSFSPPQVRGDVVTHGYDEIMNCIAQTLVRGRKIKDYHHDATNAMAKRFEHYTCHDDTLGTIPSKPLFTEKWNGETNAHVYLNERSAKVHLIKRFFSVQDECAPVLHVAEKSFHRAMHDAEGGGTISNYRKAITANVEVPYKIQARTGLYHPVVSLGRRVFDYANHVLGLNLTVDGQETLTVIRYVGKGRKKTYDDKDDAPDQYKPHCDGYCQGNRHLKGSRVATMLMYCEMPSSDGSNGATNFQLAGLHIVPEPGDAIFFSYVDPKMVMDDSLTLHSGCPIYQGTKTILSQFIRYGVDDASPWHTKTNL